MMRCAVISIRLKCWQERTVWRIGDEHWLSSAEWLVHPPTPSLFYFWLTNENQTLTHFLLPHPPEKILILCFLSLSFYFLHFFKSVLLLAWLQSSHIVIRPVHPCLSPNTISTVKANVWPVVGCETLLTKNVFTDGLKWKWKARAWRLTPTPTQPLLRHPPPPPPPDPKFPVCVS